MDIQFEQPEENVRVLEVGKNKLYLRRKDPFGFIYINWERGELPDMLKGAYTSYDEAKKKIANYLDAQSKVEMVTQVTDDSPQRSDRPGRPRT
jgi:hypothetical protein